MEEKEADRREAEGGAAAGAEEEEPAPDWGRYPAEASAIIVHHDSILRNKRLLWTYMCAAPLRPHHTFVAGSHLPSFALQTSAFRCQLPVGLCTMPYTR